MMHNNNLEITVKSPYYYIDGGGKKLNFSIPLRDVGQHTSVERWGTLWTHRTNTYRQITEAPGENSPRHKENMHTPLGSH